MTPGGGSSALPIPARSLSTACCVAGPGSTSEALQAQLRLEMQYAVQSRRDDQETIAFPHQVARWAVRKARAMRAWTRCWTCPRMSGGGRRAAARARPIRRSCCSRATWSRH